MMLTRPLAVHMADSGRGRGGFGRGRGDRGRGRRGPRRGGRKDEEKEWQPVTKLGRLVKDGKIKSMEEIYLFSLPVKEYQIIDLFLPKLKDEVMKIMPVQKQTQAGQRTRFKAFVAIGDFEGHVGLGVKCAKEVATAIRGAIILAKLSVIPVRRGYWGAALGEPHTVPSKVSGKVGSVMCRLIPAPRGTGIVAAPASKRLLQLAGVEDCYTQSKGSTATMGNFLKATFAAITKTYAFLTPDLWREIPASKLPYDEYSAHLQMLPASCQLRATTVMLVHSAPAPTPTTSRTPRTSPASRARRRAVCVFPSRPVPPIELIPTCLPDSTLLPYCHSGPTSDTSSIRSSPVPSPEVRPLRSRHTDPRPIPGPPPLVHPQGNVNSAASTPQATFAETDSDASSFYHDLEFPQPPGSPAIRRMQSAPLFTSEETDAVREFLRRRWGAHLKARSPAPTQAQEQEPLSDFSWDSESPDCGADVAVSHDFEQLELAGEALLQAVPAASIPRTSHRESWLQMTDDTHDVRPLGLKRSARQPERILRRVTSLAAPLTPLLHDTHPPLPLPPFLRFQEVPPPSSLESAGRQRPHHRPNLSMPLTGMGFSMLDGAARSTLGPSFTHRPACSQPANIPPCAMLAGNPRSFIDLTPERQVSREATSRVHRERVKRILSRAKSSFIEWSKGLTGKKDAHH
ncbi:hypothetical protein GGX14DRAFT_630352 [Mycena pura]|uniref:Small ribosomal subunit protein uS5 n=1 Tax=Mycena pura TaxID=153505 RepID=A0AAD6VKA8_9AGAR|nr:hypothetical protein GGX14DRAFT_630352 [Mycena pura]